MSDMKNPFSPGSALNINLAGVTFVDGFDELIADLRTGDELSLVDEPDNPHDPNAISVSLPTGEHLGYVPRDIAEQAPTSMADYSAYVSHIYIGTRTLNSGLAVTIYRNDITEEDLVESVKDILGDNDVLDFVTLAYEATGEPVRGGTHEISSRLRIRNCIRHLNGMGVDLKAVLFGDDLSKALPPGIKVVSERGITTLYADDLHKVFDYDGRISLTGHILREVATVITGDEVVLASLDDLE